MKSEHTLEVSAVLNELTQLRSEWRASRACVNTSGMRPLPSPEVVGGVVELLRGVLFPMYFGPSDLRVAHENYYVGMTLAKALQDLAPQIAREMACQKQAPEAEVVQAAYQLCQNFAEQLPNIRRILNTDIIAAFQGDPAASSIDEVLLCYPGIEAILHHRLAHFFYQAKLPLVARMIANRAHSRTGIDIHPGATIDSGFFIDHGTGVVIGETTIIGKHVRIYQAVTLGAKSFPLDPDGNPIKGLARHPIVEDDVIIYAGATVLGRVTIGRGSSIGGNVWLTQDVAPGSRVMQAQSQHDVSL